MNIIELQKEINENEIVIKAKGFIDSETVNEFNDFVVKTHEENKDKKLILDFSNVDMITSACIRCLLTYHKENYNYELKNINKEVFTVLKLTGVAAVLNIEQETFSISTKGCKVLGKGFHSEVFKIDDETIAKVYFDPNEIDFLIKERMIAKQAFIKGVPTEISFGMCDVDGKPGLIYELVDANTLLSVFAEHPEDMEKYIEDYVKLVKEIHKFDNEGMTSIYDKKANFIAEAEVVSQFVPKDCYEEIIKLKDKISDSNKLVHGDAHPANVMITDRGMLFIDLSDMGFGDEKFEIMFLYRTLKLFGSLPTNTYALNSEQCSKLWDLFIKEYYKGKDEKYVEEELRTVRLLALNSIIYRFCSRNPDAVNAQEMINRLIKEVRG